MSFNAVKVPIAFLLLLFLLGRVSSKEQTWRQNTGGENVRRSPSSLTEFMMQNVPLVRNSLGLKKPDVQIAAIWLDITGKENFEYYPKQKNVPGNKPVQIKPQQECGPPPIVWGENYLVCRIKSQGAEKDYIHAEQSLLNQVNQAFLEKYAKTQGKEVQRILMYSRKHPCGKCGSLLVDICKKLKQQTGLGKAFKCDVVYALPFKNYQDKAVRQKMEATGEVTVQQIAALAQL